MRETDLNKVANTPMRAFVKKNTNIKGSSAFTANFSQFDFLQTL